jgi:hypothetical protein
VQKVISHLSCSASEFIARELQGWAVPAAKNRQACRILCRLLERNLLIELMMMICKHGKNGSARGDLSCFVAIRESFEIRTQDHQEPG